MVNAKFANQKHRVAYMIWKRIRYLPFLPQICLSVCIYLLHICPEQICTNTFFRAVRVWSGKWLNLSSSIWVEKFRFTFIRQDRIIFTKITAVIMLNFSDARSYGMVSHTFRLTYSPANEVFFVVFDMFEKKLKQHISTFNHCILFGLSNKFYNGTTHIFNSIVVLGCLPHLFLYFPTSIIWLM